MAEEKRAKSVRNLKKEEILLRVDSVGEKTLILIPYVKHTTCAQILDETYGSNRWADKYEKLGDDTYCTVSIYDETAGWVSKSNVGTAGGFEVSKTVASDAFKRACVKWGIGRELYSLPEELAIDTSLCNINPDRTCSDKFSVHQLVSREDAIEKIDIFNDTTGKRVYRYPSLKAEPKPSIELVGTKEEAEKKLASETVSEAKTSTDISNEIVNDFEKSSDETEKAGEDKAEEAVKEEPTADASEKKPTIKLHPVNTGSKPKKAEKKAEETPSSVDASAKEEPVNDELERALETPADCTMYAGSTLGWIKNRASSGIHFIYEKTTSDEVKNACLVIAKYDDGNIKRDFREKSGITF